MTFLQILKDQMKIESFEAEAKMEEQRKARKKGKDGTEQVPSPLPPPHARSKSHSKNPHKYIVR